MSYTLDHWFGKPSVQSNKLFKYNYFCIKWVSNKDYKVWWSNDKPECFTCEKTINIKGHKESITLIGDIVDDGFTFPPLLIRGNYYSKNTSFLKSHLQKCIRRGLTYKAIITAFLMMENNISDLLRRLPIIILEDVHIIKDMDIICWFMVMEPHISIPSSFRQWILYIIKYICEFPHKDLCRHIVGDPSYKDINNIPMKYRSTIYSLVVRRAYGGMKGDMSMIDFIVDKWIRKLNKNKDIPTIQPNDIIIMKTLEPKLYERAGVDFHCYPKMLDIIQERHPQYHKVIIKRALWNKSSKLNYRVKQYMIDKEIEECWKEIKTDVIQIQDAYIKRSIWKMY